MTLSIRCFCLSFVCLFAFRAYRLFDRGPTFRHETKQNMLDGTLLWRFVGLDARTQHDLTRAIGTTVERVMSNLLDIDLASLF